MCECACARVRACVRVCVPEVKALKVAMASTCMCVCACVRACVRVPDEKDLKAAMASTYRHPSRRNTVNRCIGKMADSSPKHHANTMRTPHGGVCLHAPRVSSLMSEGFLSERHEQERG